MSLPMQADIQGQCRTIIFFIYINGYLSSDLLMLNSPIFVYLSYA